MYNLVAGNMQSLAFGVLLFAVLQNTPQLQAKLAIWHAPKSSKLLSKILNGDGNIFENDGAQQGGVFRQQEQEELHRLQDINDFDQQLFEYDYYEQEGQRSAEWAFVDYFEAARNEPNTTSTLTAKSAELPTLWRKAAPATNATKSNSQLQTTTTTATKTKALHAQMNLNEKSKMPAAILTAGRQAPQLLQQQQQQQQHSVSSNKALLNPFGQLGTLFGYGVNQLHFQHYNFLFNAERHTVFLLHTNTNASSSAVDHGRVLHTVVTNSIGAAFGAGTGAATAPTAVRVEEVKLYNPASLRQSRFNPFNPTRILIHGWFGGSHSGFFNTVIPAYLKLAQGRYNVFTVDWGRGAIADYITASYRVKPVGKVVAKFIDFLHREAGMRYEDLHVIGFSMGAHVAGIAGKHVQTGRLPLIYALDPALPFFRFERIDERVSLVDADYVEVIHTSVGSYGYDQPLGHVDFYMNYGSNQPGCFLNECSHMRAYQVFAEALQSPVGFRGRGCDVQLWRDMTRHRRCLMGTGLEMTMGGDPKNVTALRGRGGVFYVVTNANAPFAKA